MAPYQLIQHGDERIGLCATVKATGEAGTIEHILRDPDDGSELFCVRVNPVIRNDGLTRNEIALERHTSEMAEEDRILALAALRRMRLTDRETEQDCTTRNALEDTLENGGTLSELNVYVLMTAIAHGQGHDETYNRLRKLSL